ncbi:MAG: DUF4349 domain-containing protein [Lachnospiraceae bacterium]|nr:DUF4349 domain-containing protein [Lachnospiraceae bacterium]
MKGNMLNTRKMAILLAVVLLLAGCGSGSDGAYKNATASSTDGAYYASDDIYSYAEEAAVEEDYDEYGDDIAEEGETKVQETPGESNRKLIKRVELTVETTEFDTLVERISERVDKIGGYIESSEIYGGGLYDSRTNTAEYTIRIPSAKLDSFVDAVSADSNVTHKTQNVEDITLQYVDTKSKKEALEVEQKRLLDLLDKADSLEAIITLESRLTDVRYELQSMESRLRTYDNQVDYATVRITVREVEIYTEPEPVGIWDEMLSGFAKSVREIKDSIVRFFVDLVAAIPYLVVWGIILVILILVLRGIFKHSKKRAERKKAREAGQTDARSNTQPGDNEAEGNIKDENAKDGEETAAGKEE